MVLLLRHDGVTIAGQRPMIVTSNRESLAINRVVGSLSLFYSYYFGFFSRGLASCVCLSTISKEDGVSVIKDRDVLLMMGL